MPDTLYNNDAIELWADNLLETLSLEEKIGQLFMIAANGKNLGSDYYNKVDSLITNYKVGGVIFFQSGPQDLINTLNRYNKQSSIPLLTSIDAEWGLSMRLDSVQHFPWMMTLGAVQDLDLIYNFGLEVARQLKSLGVHMNFAPVVDVNNNPNNPIIDRRAFGSNVDLVALQGLAYMQGMQANNILSCAKHFPGHGDTDVDSHKKLPVLYHDRHRLDSLEFVPFNHLINNGLGAIMIAHMNLPLIDTMNQPSSFSSYLIQDILKNELNFNGLVVSDALNMGALSNYTDPGEIELNAFLAGNDILLCPDNLSEAIALIKAEIRSNPVLMNQLNQSCKNILMVKKWTGAFDKLQHIKPSDLINEYSEFLNKKLCEKSLTVLVNQNNVLPLLDINKLKVAYVGIGDSEGDAFYDRLNHYIPISRYTHSSNSEILLNNLKQYDLAIVGAHYKDDNFWDKHIVSVQDSLFLDKLSAQNKTILTVFGHPKLLNSFPSNNIDGQILSYQNSDLLQDLTAQLIFGSIGASGRIPVSTNHFFEGEGINIASVRNLEFVLPVEVGLSKDSLAQIDSLVQMSIQDGVMPGCQIVVSRYGKILYNKAFGFHSYTAIEPVTETDLYDIASITKITAAAPIFMQLTDNNSIKLHKKIKKYLSASTAYADKKNLKIIDIFTHQAQLFPWIPFWKSFQDDKVLNPLIFSQSKSPDYNIKVAGNLFFNQSYIDTIYKIILETPLLKKKEYKYSDLGFYLLQPVVEDMLGVKIDKYVCEELYQPIGAHRITYNPLDKFSLSSIVPTENDVSFRGQLIQGYVHDQGASLFGGVGLHAGLFSNAIDLAKFMHLYLNNGRHMNHQILPKRRINQFTSSPFDYNNNRRGIIFDKPSIDPSESGPTCDSISLSSFGHSGFTGTLAWIDPEIDLVYIFLSNGRVFPNGNNTKLIDRNVRTDVQAIIYNSIKE